MLTVYCRPVHDDRGYQDDYWGPGDPLLTRVGAPGYPDHDTRPGHAVQVGAPGYPDHDTRPGHAGQVGAPGYPDHDTRLGYPGQDPGYHDPYHQSGHNGRDYYGDRRQWPRPPPHLPPDRGYPPYHHHQEDEFHSLRQRYEEDY